MICLRKPPILVSQTDIAATYHLPATYDAHYLALAEHLGVELWTADTRLVNALLPFKLDWVKLAQG